VPKNLVVVDKVSERTESRISYPPGRPQGSPPRSLTYTHSYSRENVVE